LFHRTIDLTQDVVADSNQTEMTQRMFPTKPRLVGNKKSVTKYESVNSNTFLEGLLTKMESRTIHNFQSLSYVSRYIWTPRHG